MDVFDFIKAAKAEIACNRAVVIDGVKRTIIARVINNVMTLTEEGDEMMKALEAKKTGGKRKAAPKPDPEPEPEVGLATGEAVTDGDD